MSSLSFVILHLLNRNRNHIDLTSPWKPLDAFNIAPSNESNPQINSTSLDQPWESRPVVKGISVIIILLFFRQIAPIDMLLLSV